MSIFKKFKNFFDHVNSIENNILSSKEDYLAVYERNIELEKEIELRTNELHQANKTLMNLQNIWEMMNSSQPLSIIFENIISGLQCGLDYPMSLIMQKKDEGDDSFFQIKAFVENKECKLWEEKLEFPINHYKLNYNENDEIGRALASNIISYTKEIDKLLNSLLPDLPADIYKNTEIYKKTKSIIILPLYSNNKPFGIILVFSPRDSYTQNEHTFLNLFDYQTELAITIANLFEEIKRQAVTDPLTELYNRRYFLEALEKEAERAHRSKEPFSIISLDLDHLKTINDTHGHAVGDIAIKTIAQVLKRNARTIDTPARLGGEEFCVLLPSVDTEKAKVVAERIRESIANQQVDVIGHVTASLGLATFGVHSENLEELLEIADQAMYKAKINGRNQVQIPAIEDETEWQKTAIQAFIEILSKRRIPIAENVADDICSKLKEKENCETNTRELIFETADAISSTYNELNFVGLTKNKVILAVKIAKKMELTKDDITKLRIAMLLYDIGKSLVPEEIFAKKDPLTQEEKDLLKQHPITGVQEILKPISFISDVLPIIEKHHEYWDGTGYPYNLSGDEIPITSQIVLLVDAYSALTQNRPYRSSLNQEEAIDVIKNEVNKKWSPELLNIFLQIICSENAINESKWSY